jgi:hypothetical protein
LPTVGHIAQGLRGRLSVRLLALVGLIVVTFLASRSCQRNYVRITSDQAVAIGQREIDFRPRGHTVRLVQQGVPPRRFWAISYWIRDRKDPCQGGYSKLTVVLVNGNTGAVGDVLEKCN